MADVTERLLALLSTLQTGRAFGGQELADRLGVSPRTLRRDVDRLRAYGYPVDAQPGPGGHYRLTAGRTMPPLVLDDGEAIAALLGVALLAGAGSGGGGALDEAATRAYGKLDQFLPTRLRPQAVSVRASLETRHPPGPDVDTALVTGLAGAITDQRAVRFDHRGRDGDLRPRRVEPHRLVHLHLRWYFLGWDLDRDDWRVFRLDRITGLVRTTTPCAPRPLPAATAVEYLRRGMDADRREVQLVVRAPAHRVADALKYQDADIEPVADGPDGEGDGDGVETRVRVRLDSWEWLVLNLAQLDADFRILAPADIQAACAAFAARLLAGAGAPAQSSDEPMQGRRRTGISARRP